jgi:hypothetical protein
MNPQASVRPLPIRIANHNQTVVAPFFVDGLATNHNQTLVVPAFGDGLATNHNQTIVRG